MINIPHYHISIFPCKSTKINKELISFNYLCVFLWTVDKLLGEFLQSDPLLIYLHDALEGGLAASGHLAGQMENVNGIGYGYLAVTQDGEKGRLARTVEAEETVTSSTIQLERRVLHELAAVESHGEGGDLDVTTARVRRQGASARAGLRVQAGVRFEFRA